MNLTKKTVAVAMSGGVDSSVAAALLKDQGFRVFGVMLRLWAEEGGHNNRCCAPGAVNDAREVAAVLGIPFYVLDYKDAFKTEIVDYFTQAYIEGETPNPCVFCNRDIRFGRLLKEVSELGADYLATGHYARIVTENDGRVRMYAGRDEAKDQSYMLYRLGQNELKQAMFPIGDIPKPEVREIAQAHKLPVFAKRDSQDLCFLGEGGHRGFAQRNMTGSLIPGKAILTDGRQVGEHHGLPLYTIGQRKGLGISWEKPLFVVEKDHSTNTLVLGTEEATFYNKLEATRAILNIDVGLSEFKAKVKIRYKSPPINALVVLTGPGKFEVLFDEPVRDVTPGQSIVLYEKDAVLGGGIIGRGFRV